MSDVATILEYWAARVDLPESNAQMTSYFGIQKKSSGLILLKTLFLNLGIATDRHCIWGFIGLDWVHPGEGSLKNPPGLSISQQMEMWMEPEHWADINNLVASIRQMWGIGKAENPIRAAMSQLASTAAFLQHPCCSPFVFVPAFFIYF